MKINLMEIDCGTVTSLNWLRIWSVNNNNTGEELGANIKTFIHKADYNVVGECMLYYAVSRFKLYFWSPTRVSMC